MPSENRQALAEREGFEPPVPLSTVVFKTTVIDHSTISPVPLCLESGCKGTCFFGIEQIFRQLFAYKNEKLYFELCSKVGCISEKLKYIWFFVRFALPLQRDLPE